MKNQKIELNKEFCQALDLMEKTKQNVFVTGRAGTGKSTLLQYFRAHTKKNVAILAPTGVAAVNIKGQTIHSFFGFKPDITVEIVRKKYKNPRKKDLYKKLDSILIDETSMVRADLLDCVDAFLRLNGPKKNIAFGGLQMIFIGDLYQLPPVVTSQEKMLFTTYYQSPYFFDSQALQNFLLSFVQLEKVYRQKDDEFLSLLNAVRNRSVNEEDLQKLNTRLNAAFKPSQKDFFIYLTTTNKMAEEVNKVQLSKLSAPFFNYDGIIEGDFDIKALPISLNLNLKVGAQVMLVNNDKQGRWINGTIGKIVEIEKDAYENSNDGDDDDFYQDESLDAILVELEGGEVVDVLPYTWEMFRFFYNPQIKKLDSETVGSFTQYPLILAWAITIHKSQGKTFEKVILDIGRGTFAHGQTYVALSRCTTLSGLILKKPLQKKHILMDWRVVKFLTNFQYQRANKQMSVDDKVAFIEKAIKEKAKLKVVYLKNSDEKSERVITPKEVGKTEYMDKEFLGMRAYCYNRKDERMFRVDRILELARA